jgi:uracil-DNA glycosylase family 4
MDDRELRLAQLRHAIQRCTICNPSAHGLSPVPGKRSTLSRLFLLGFAPNSAAPRHGQPFPQELGTGGRLTSFLRFLGLSQEDVYVTNAYKCYLGYSSGQGGTFHPAPEVLKNCLKWLRDELSVVTPKVVIALGSQAREALRNICQLPDLRYEGEQVSKGGVTYYGLSHPRNWRVVWPLSDLSDEELRRFLPLRQILMQQGNQ